MTDSGLRALASGGCGEKLMSLSLLGECCCVPVCELLFCGSGRVGVPDVRCCLARGLFLSYHLVSLLFAQRAGLKGDVTDSGLRALASAGCGEKLTSLSLQCES